MNHLPVPIKIVRPLHMQRTFSPPIGFRGDSKTLMGYFGALISVASAEAVLRNGESEAVINFLDLSLKAIRSGWL